MLFPVACFSCGSPVQQYEDQYYKLVDNYTKKQNQFFIKPEIEILKNELYEFFSTKKNQQYETLVYAIKDESTFEQNVINLAQIYKENENLNQLAFFYKYSPEFLALKEIGISEKRYCCRRMFLCHPRDLNKLIL